MSDLFDDYVSALIENVRVGPTSEMCDRIERLLDIQPGQAGEVASSGAASPIEPVPVAGPEVAVVPPGGRPPAPPRPLFTECPECGETFKTQGMGVHRRQKHSSRATTLTEGPRPLGMIAGMGE